MSRTCALALVFVVLLVLFVNLVSSVGGIDETEDHWTKRSPMPTARSKLGVAVVDGKIYAIGGETSWGNYSKANEMYDPTNGAWTKKQQMPTPRTLFGIAVYEGKIYCIGGARSMGYSGSEPTGLNTVYSTETDSWSSRRDLPTPRNCLQANVVNGKIYLIGGRLVVNNSPYTSNLNNEYDISTDTWTTRKPIPTPVHNYASAVVDDKIYIIGGFNSQEESSIKLMQIYDPATDSWSNGAAPPDGVGTAAGATTGVYAPKKIYVIGYSDIFAHNPNHVYDPQTNQWSGGKGMPTARGFLGIGVVNDILYAIGGTGENYLEPPVSANEQYTPIGYGTIPANVPDSNLDTDSFPTTLIAVAAVASTATIAFGLLAYSIKKQKSKQSSATK